MILKLIKVFVTRFGIINKIKLNIYWVKIIEREKKQRKVQKSSARNIRC